MDARFEHLYEMCLSELTTNLLPWWMEYSVDEKHGGFYGSVTNDNEPVAGAEKHIVLNARLVWTFASAYRVLKDDRYLSYARRAYEYLVERFWDAEHGGVFTLLDADGKVLNADKMIYGNAFAVYALSEYHRATGDARARKYANDLVEKLETFAFDPVNGGFFEVCGPDFRHDPWKRGMNRYPNEQKTMNTHLHLIEAYTCLLRSDPSVQSRVRYQLYNMLSNIVNRATHHFHYFQDVFWHPTTSEVSFGHDIEGSWLMMEAAEVLHEPEAEAYARDVCVNIARACLTEGVRPDGFMNSEYDPVKRHTSERLSWWEQNESVVGFLNAWEETGEDKFLDASLRCMQSIDAKFVDHEKGGWFAILSPDYKPLSTLKQTGFICPYHNARMCLEVIERYRRH